MSDRFGKRPDTETAAVSPPVTTNGDGGTAAVCADQLNRQFGAGTLRFAVAGIQQNWKLKAAHRLDRDTTCWQEMMNIVP